MGKLILFVCTGNTCRSPMAEYYFNGEMKKIGKEAEFIALSRGLYAENSLPMSGNAKKVLISQNIIGDSGSIFYKSSQIDGEIMREADYVYGITENHSRVLKEHYPQHHEKIFTMPENIGDPYGGSLEIYENCFQKIKKAVNIIIESIL